MANICKQVERYKQEDQIHALSDPFSAARSDVVVKIRLFIGIGRV